MNTATDQLLTNLGHQDGIWFQPNPGNAGDSLLAVAARQKFRKLGLRVHEIGPDFDATDKVVVYGGGGNLVRYYRVASDFLERHHERARHLVVLPHSVDGHEDLLGRLGPNVTIVCRERFSFQHCSRHAHRANVLLGHDLAIETELRPLRPWAGPVELATHGLVHLVGAKAPLPARVAYARKVVGALRRTLSTSLSTGPRLPAFRTDIENGIGDVPAGNLDLSELFMLHDATRRGANLCVRLLCGFLSRHEVVATDRLHVAIAAALLGLEVELHPNSYYKCAAVWEHSLKSRFPRIRWMGTDPSVSSAFRATDIVAERAGQRAF